MNPENRIFVGGSGSSGTTLVKEILNSHSLVYCGEEISLLDRNIALDDPAQDLVNLMKLDQYRKLDQQMPYPIMVTGGNSKSYTGISSWRWPEVFRHSSRDEVIKKYDTDTWRIKDMVNFLLSSEMVANGKKFWAEKSPGNIFYFDRMHKVWPESKFIMCVRNPWDTIYSLIFNRGFTQHEAITRWTASINAIELHLNNLAMPKLIVSYDELLSDPGKVVEEIWDFLDIQGDAFAGAELVEKKPSTFHMYQDRVIPGVQELVYFSCTAVWERFCVMNNIPRGVTVE
jgi:hypothetical protein